MSKPLPPSPAFASRPARFSRPSPQESRPAIAPGRPRAARRRLPLATAAALAALGVLTAAASERAGAQTTTWMGGNLLWGDAANWTNGLPTASSGSVAVFDTTSTNKDVYVAENHSVGLLRFGSGSIGSYTFRPFIVNGAVPIVSLYAGIDNRSTSAQTILTALNLAAANTWTLGTGSSLTVSGTVSGSNTLTITGSGALTLSGANTHTGTTTLSGGTLTLGNALALQNSTLTVSGGALSFGSLTAATLGGLTGATNLALTNGGANVALTVGGNNGSTTYSGVLSGTGSLTKTGTGTLTLSGANTYTGTTTISAGTLTLGNASALQNSTLAYKAGGGTLSFGSLTSATLAGLSGAKNLALTNTGNAAVALTVGNGGVSSGYGGVLSGTGSLTKTGAGTLTLTGANTHTGTTTISAGTLTLGNALALQNSTLAYNAGTLSFGSLTAATLGGLNGFQNLALANNSNAAVALTVGGNNASTDYAGTLSGTGSLTKTGTGTLTLIGTHTYSGGTTVSGGTLQLGDTFDNNGSVPGNVTLSTIGATLAFANPNAQTFSGVISGSGAVTKSGAGNLTLSGANTFTGTTTLSAGTITLGNASALQNSTLAYSAGTLSFGSLTAATLGGLSGSQNLTLTNTGNTAVALTVGGNNASTTYAGVLSGAGGLTKTGSGTLTLSGANTYTGNTTVGGGTLTLGNGLALRNSTLTVSDGTFSFGAVASATLGGLTGATNLALTNSGGANVALTVGGNNGSTIYSGVLSGGGSLTKAGTGNLTLSGTNTFTGDTTLSGGTLTLGNALALRNSTLNLSGVFNVGTLSFGGLTAATLGGLTGTQNLALTNGSNAAVALTVGGGNASTTYAGVLSGAGGLTKTGTGTLTLLGTQTYSGGTTISAGTLQLGDGSDNNGSVSGNIANNAALLFANPNAQTYSGIIGGSGTLVKTGAGKLTLTNANSFSGGVTVSGGTLALSAPVGTGSNNFGGALQSSITVSGTGATLEVNATDQTANTSTLTVGGGGAVNLTAGHTSFAGVALSGNATVYGATGDPLGLLLFGGAPLTATGTNNTISAPLGLNGANTVTVTGAGDALTIGGVIAPFGSGALVKAGAGTLTLTAANTYTGTTTVSAGTLQLGNGSGANGSVAGNIANNAALTFANPSAQTYSGVISGTGGLTKTGAGTLTLTGANTYSGVTTVSAGTLTLSGGSFGGNIVNDGTLNLDASGTYSGDTSGTGSVGIGGWYSTAVFTGANTYTGGTTFTGTSGTLQVGDGLTTNGSLQGDIRTHSSNGHVIFANPFDQTFSGRMRDAVDLTKRGAGTLTLTGANDARGTIIIEQGTLRIGDGLTTSGAINGESVRLSSGATLEFANISDVTFGRQFFNTAGGGKLVKSGAGNLIMEVQTLTFRGTTEIRDGILTLNSDESLAFSTLDYNYGGRLSFGTQSWSALGALTGAKDLALVNEKGEAVTLYVGLNQATTTYDGLFSGAGRLHIEGGTLILTRDHTYTGGTVADYGNLQLGDGVSRNASVIGDIENRTTVIFANPFDQTFSGILYGQGTLEKKGAGDLTLSGANTFHSTTAISGGTLTLGNALALQRSTLDYNNYGGALSFGTQTAVTLGGLSGAQSLALTNSSNAAVALTVGGNEASTTYSGVLSGGGGLTKTGTGTLTLSGANTYSGGTTISAGTLTLGDASALQASTLDYNGYGGALSFGSLASATLGGLSGTQNLALANSDGANVALMVGGNDASTTYSGVLSGGGGLTKSGAGTLTLTGAHTYTGGTTNNAGTLQLGDGTALNGSLAGNIANNAALAFANPFDQTYSGVISGGGSLTKTGAGTLTLTGANNIGGDKLIQAGTLRFGDGVAADSSPGEGRIYIDAGATMEIATVSDLTLRNRVFCDADGTIIKSGTGNLILETPTFAGSPEGTFRIHGGTLTINSVFSMIFATLDYNNHGGRLSFGTRTLQAIGGLTGSQDLALVNENGQAVTLFLGRGKQVGSYDGVLSGTGGLTIEGTGRVITLTRDQTYTGETKITFGTLQLGDGVSRNGSVAGNITNNAALAFAHPFDQTYSGVISGSGTVTKSGAGNLTLSGANTHTGGTSIGAGTLTLGNALALQNSTLSYSGNGALSFGSLTSATLGGLSGTKYLALTNADGQAVALTVGGNGANTSYSGTLSGGGGLTKIGAGNLTLGYGNSFSGATAIHGGALTLGFRYSLYGSTLDYNNYGGALSFGSLSAVNLGGLSGAQNLTLTNSYGGNVALDVGGNDGSTSYGGVLSGGGSLTKSGSGTLTLSGSNTYTGGTTISAGTLELGDALALQNSTLSYAGSGGALSFGSLTSATLGGLSGARSLALTNSSDASVALTVGGNNASTVYSGVLSGGGNLTKSGSGTLTLSGANTYTGGTTISAGTLQLGDGTTANGSVEGSITNNAALVFANPFAQTHGGVVSGTGSLTKTGAGTLTITNANTHTGGTTISAGTVDMSSGTIAGDIRNDATINFSNNSPRTYSGVISGTGSVIKSTSGLLTLTGANTYTGTTTLTGIAQLRLGNGSSANGSVAGNIVMASGNTTLLLDNPFTQTYDGVISGTGRIIKNSTSRGTFILTGASTYTGSISINNGTLQLGDGTTKNGSIAGNISVSSILAFANPYDQTYSGVISGGGVVEKSGAGTLTLTGANTHAAWTTINAGTLRLGNGTTTNGSVSARIINNAALVFANPLAQTYTNIISGSGTLTKTGAGTLTLTGASTFTGGSTLSAGTVAATGTALGTGAVTVQSGATLAVGGTVNASLAAQAVNTLTLTSLALQSASGLTTPLLTFDLGANGLSDLLVLTGTAAPFSFSSSSASGDDPLVVGFGSATGAGLGSGTWTLMSFATAQDASALPSAGVFRAKAVGNLRQVEGGQFAWATNGDGKVTGLEFSSTAADVTPEPGSLALVFLAGLPAAGAAVRRRLRHA